MHLQDCPRTYPLAILSRKWSYRVMRTLHQTQTFSGVLHELKFITNRILSRELKQLQAEGIITLHNHTYRLTPSGEALLNACETLNLWSSEHAGLRQCPVQHQCSRCLHYVEAGRQRYASSYDTSACTHCDK